MLIREQCPYWILLVYSIHLCQPTTIYMLYPQTPAMYLVPQHNRVISWTAGIKFQEYSSNSQIGAKSLRKHRNHLKQIQAPMWKTTNLNWFVRFFLTWDPESTVTGFLLKDKCTPWILLLHLCNAPNLSRSKKKHEKHQSIFKVKMPSDVDDHVWYPLFVSYLLPVTFMQQGVSTLLHLLTCYLQEKSSEVKYQLIMHLHCIFKEERLHKRSPKIIFFWSVITAHHFPPHPPPTKKGNKNNLCFFLTSMNEFHPRQTTGNAFEC